MRDRHEPHDDFVEKLEWQIGREVRRRNTAADSPRLLTWSRSRVAAAAAALIIVSMAIGGAAVAAAYEAQSNQRRDQLIVSVEQRLRLAEMRLQLAKDELQQVQQRVSVGMANNLDLAESQNRAAEAEMQLHKIRIDLEEVRLSGAEPRNELSAPLVSGQDFVGRRLRSDLRVIEQTLSLEKMRLQDAQTRFELGVMDASAVDVPRIRVIELDSALRAIQSKIGARDKFIAGKADATETELRLLEAEAEQQQRTLKPKLDLANKEFDRTKRKVDAGLAQQMELSAATLKRMELEMSLLKVDIELKHIRSRLTSGK
jgi:hypothetical protein